MYTCFTCITQLRDIFKFDKGVVVRISEKVGMAPPPNSFNIHISKTIEVISTKLAENNANSPYKGYIENNQVR